MNKEWYTIDKAPKNTVILTNLGLAKYIEEGSPSGWYLCDSKGEVPYCVDYGIVASKLGAPRIWTYFNPPEQTSNTFDYNSEVEKGIEEIALKYAHDYPDIAFAGELVRLWAIKKTLEALTQANQELQDLLNQNKCHNI